ncbi:hypothetical protein [Marinobacter sp. VGCF2001]|uniref:hypothetical protein n=1 Tax=Marinobacter sp. VGCF2001 TaxID=3417189 RepID=UPI003CF3197A
MRWLALLLLIVNLVLWFVPASLSPPASVTRSTGTLPRVSSLKPAEAVRAPRRTVTECLSVTMGYFDNRTEAVALAEELTPEPRIVALERSLTPLHWILIPPQPPEAARVQFRELYLAGVDAYIVSRGEYQNAISLGLFESLEAAQSVLAEKKRANLNVVLAKFPRNRLGYALVFQVESRSETEWVQAVEAETGREFTFVESKPCEGVASPEKNP